MIRFDPYAVRPPLYPLWDYVVDDAPIRRAAAGESRLLSDGHPAVRLAPDCAFRAWRNEHVLVHEDRSPPTLWVRAAVWVRARGPGADVLDFEARLEDPAGGGRAVIMAPSAQLPGAVMKVAKIVDWYRAERARRDLGCSPMLTALELWTGERRMATAS